MAKQPTPRALTRKHLARLEREKIQQRYLIGGTIVIIVLVVGLILYGFLDQNVFTRLRPVAKVGNETITTGDFQKQVRFNRYRLIDQLQSLAGDPVYAQFFGSYISQITTQLASPSAIGQEVLDSMIENEIIRMEAEKRGITVTEEELDRELEQAFGFFENGTPTPTITSTPYSTSTLSPEQEALFPPTSTPGPTEQPTDSPAGTVTPTEAGATATQEATVAPTSETTPTPDASPTITLTPTITPTPTAYTRDLFSDNLDQYVENAESIKFSRNDLREYVRSQVLRRKVYEAVTTDVPTTAEQIWARHILVPSEEVANQVLERMQAGEKFDDLARELSTDTSNKDQGGDLGWFTRGKMVVPFEEAAFQLQVGEISQPVQTDFGYHIIQVLGHEERPLDATQIDEARSKAYTDWLEEAKKAANVETFDRWTSVVPTEPTIPPDLAANLPAPQQDLPALPVQDTPAP